MLNKIILLITILSYTVVVSQPFMYLLALKNTQLALNGSTYTEVRQLIDGNMRSLFKYVMYAALLASLLLLILNFKNPASLLFISSLIAFVALVADVLLTLKGNVPINNIINGWSPENYPANWMKIRKQWFAIFHFRQLATITGFISLLVGVVFSRN